jgi:uncharacterized protein with HEPN domain
MKRVWSVVRKDIPELKEEIHYIMENKDAG